jgi:hypothetical protein
VQWVAASRAIRRRLPRNPSPLPAQSVAPPAQSVAASRAVDRHLHSSRSPRSTSTARPTRYYVSACEPPIRSLPQLPPPTPGDDVATPPDIPAAYFGARLLRDPRDHDSDGRPIEPKYDDAWAQGAEEALRARWRVVKNGLQKIAAGILSFERRPLGIERVNRLKVLVPELKQVERSGLPRNDRGSGRAGRAGRG